MTCGTTKIILSHRRGLLLPPAAAAAYFAIMISQIIVDTIIHAKDLIQNATKHIALTASNVYLPVPYNTQDIFMDPYGIKDRILWNLWPIIGIIVVLIYPLFYIFTPYTTNEQLNVKSFNVIAFLKETVMIFILIPLSLYISLFCFIRWGRVWGFLNWTPEKGGALTLIQLDASVIVGVLILLSFTIGGSGYNETDIKLIVTGTQKSFHVNGFDVKPSTNQPDIRTLITALTASVVAQFAISAIIVGLFSNIYVVRYAFPQFRKELQRQEQQQQITVLHRRRESR